MFDCLALVQLRHTFHWLPICVSMLTDIKFTILKQQLYRYRYSWEIIILPLLPYLIFRLQIPVILKSFFSYSFKNCFRRTFVSLRICVEFCFKLLNPQLTFSLNTKVFHALVVQRCHWTFSLLNSFVFCLHSILQVCYSLTLLKGSQNHMR